MLQEVISLFNEIDPVWIYFIIFFFAFIENLFPPSPSDVVVIAGALILSEGWTAFLPVLFVTTAGSVIGFTVMFYIGRYSGNKIVRSGRLEFINPQDLHKVDNWFSKYGYYLIVINRFLPGTRAVISFFGGLHNLTPLKTILLAAFSALLWNIFLVSIGIYTGDNIEAIDSFLSEYSRIVLIVTGIVILVFVIYKYFTRNKNN